MVNIMMLIVRAIGSSWVSMWAGSNPCSLQMVNAWRYLTKAPAGRIRSLLTRVDDFQHLGFFIALVSSVHVERLRIAVDEFPDGTMGHLSSVRFGMVAFESDGFPVRARRALHNKYPCAHRIHPGRHIFLGHIVVGVNPDS